MGREIRRVPANWEHPKEDSGHYIPMLDQTWEEAMTEWLQKWQDWKDDEDGERARVEKEYDISCFAEWHGNPPGYEYHRPAYDSEPTHYQIYETVSEGTPVSPVFASLDEMKAWLLNSGFSEKAATRFVKSGWAPSFVMNVTAEGTQMSGLGIASLDFET